MAFYEIDINTRDASYEDAGKKIKSVKRAFESDDSDVKIALELRKMITSELNKELIPVIRKEVWCGTCGSHSHLYHPATGHCFICNTENF